MSNETGKHIWDYFVKYGETAKCSLCNNILKISQRSTTGLKYHLKSKHCIHLANAQTPVTVSEQKIQSEPSTSKDDPVNTADNRQDIAEPRNKIARKSKPDSYLVKDHSRDFMISRMVAKDGLSFNRLSSSEDLRYLFSKSRLSLPTSPSTIKSIVDNFSLTVRDEITRKVQNLKIRGEKFSLTCEEWTSAENKRYLNVNVHHVGTYFNLGLIRIHSFSSAEDFVQLVRARLEAFFLHLDTDIVGITTDDKCVMQKASGLLSCYQQLCFANGVHLAVLDILYTNESAVYSSDDDSDSCDDETGERQILSSVYLQTEQFLPKLAWNYTGLIDKVRKAVKFFRKSPRNNTCLQDYVQQCLGKKDYCLILGCKRSWSSLFHMLKRFNFLKNCTSKALIDLGSDINFSAEEWTSIKELLLCLEPVKLAVEVLCRRDSTLLTADTTLRFVLEKLDKQKGRVSADLAIALRKRIKERRTVLSGIFLYLHNPKKYERFIENADNTFSVPNKNCICLEIIKICNRMLNFYEKKYDENVEDIENTTENEMQSINEESDVGTRHASVNTRNFHNIIESGMTEHQNREITSLNERYAFIKSERIDDEEITIEESVSINEELEMQLNKDKSDTGTVNSLTNSPKFQEIIQTEMIEYENMGIKGKHLSLVHNYLNTISPTSIAAERAFSTANWFTCSPIGNKLSDKTIDTISLLRFYFHNNDM